MSRALLARGRLRATASPHPVPRYLGRRARSRRAGDRAAAGRRSTGRRPARPASGPWRARCGGAGMPGTRAGSVLPAARPGAGTLEGGRAALGVPDVPRLKPASGRAPVPESHPLSPSARGYSGVTNASGSSQPGSLPAGARGLALAAPVPRRLGGRGSRWGSGGPGRSGNSSGSPKGGGGGCRARIYSWAPSFRAGAWDFKSGVLCSPES